MKTPFIILLILLYSTLTFGQNKEVYQKIGDSLMAKEKFDELVVYFEKELKTYPKSENVLRWLGYVHIAKNNPELAEEFYLRALSVNPECARCFLNIGKTYSMRGDHNQALEYLNTAIKTDPEDALLYSSRGSLKEILGDNFGALRDHNKAIEIDPTNADYYIQSGLFNSNAGYPSIAVSDFSKAIELSPDNYNPYFRRASLYYGQQRYAEAMSDLNIAIELDSNQQSLYIGRGAVYDVMQEFQKAVNDYSKAISLDSTNFLSYLNRAGSYYKLENLDASCTDFFILKSLIENDKNIDREVIKEVSNGILNHCDDSKPSYYYQRGVGYYNLKDFQKAISFYEKGLVIFPENGMMLLFKGNTHLAINEYEKASEYYKRSLKYKESLLTEIRVNPNFTSAPNEQINIVYNGVLASTYYSLSECYVNLGLYDEALTSINTALERAPVFDDFILDAYYNLRGYIFLMTGEFEKAILDFNRSIRTNKNFSLAYANRALAKVCLSGKVKIDYYSVRVEVDHPTKVLKLESFNKKSSANAESNITAAIADCNKAIEIDETLALAYSIRGQINQILNLNDPCGDLLKASALGMVIEDELLKECKR